MENIGKRLVNSKEGKVEFDKPSMPLATLMHYGEQAGVERPSWGAGFVAHRAKEWSPAQCVQEAACAVSFRTASHPHPSAPLPLCPPAGNLLVEEQENVKRVQLADEYLSGAVSGQHCRGVACLHAAVRLPALRPMRMPASEAASSVHSCAAAQCGSTDPPQTPLPLHPAGAGGCQRQQPARGLPGPVNGPMRSRAAFAGSRR